MSPFAPLIIDSNLPGHPGIERTTPAFSSALWVNVRMTVTAKGFPWRPFIPVSRD
jgi:hypothetical protein